VFDKLEADLAKACMSLPAAKGFEVGSGFEGTMLTGKDHNDEFYIDPETGAARTKTNRSGGIQGGISNGEVRESEAGERGRWGCWSYDGNIPMAFTL